MKASSFWDLHSNTSSRQIKMNFNFVRDVHMIGLKNIIILKKSEL